MQIVKEIYDAVVARDPEQPEFHQAVWEVLESLGLLWNAIQSTSTSSSVLLSQSVSSTSEFLGSMTTVTNTSTVV